jgi:DNA-binding IclR family transcriptional regulator
VGFVRRLADGRFVPGLALTALGAAALEQLDLRDAAHTQVRRLHQVVGHTVHVGALVGDEIIYVDKVEDTTGVRMYSRLGARVQPNCSGIGKAILAGLPPARRDAVLASCDWHQHTARTITTRAALDVELASTARRGWAVDDAEFEDFVACVAVPITTSAGTVGALSLTALRVVQNVQQLQEHVPLLLETAAAISRDLG